MVDFSDVTEEDKKNARVGEYPTVPGGEWILVNGEVGLRTSTFNKWENGKATNQKITKTMLKLTSWVMEGYSADDGSDPDSWKGKRLNWELEWDLSDRRNKAVILKLLEAMGHTSPSFDENDPADMVKTFTGRPYRAVTANNPREDKNGKTWPNTKIPKPMDNLKAISQAQVRDLQASFPKGMLPPPDKRWRDFNKTDGGQPASVQAQVQRQPTAMANDDAWAPDKPASDDGFHDEDLPF